MMNSRLMIVLISWLSMPAHAAPLKLRMAALAPEGTAWARELQATARDIEADTDQELHLKWYLGGIAGDEMTGVERIRRGQLDGMAGAGFCERLAPSLRVTRIIELLQDRGELKYVMSRMRTRIDEEMNRNGFVALMFSSFGTPILMTRKPVRSMDDLRKTRLWVWNEDDVAMSELRRMGVPVVPGEVTDAAAAFAEGRVDGFVAVPAAGLAYQWSTQARYFTELPIGFLPACMVMAQRAFNALPFSRQGAIRGAVAKLGAHYEDTGRAQDEALLGGLFDKQGMKRVPVSEVFRSQFREEARHARDAVAADVVAPELLTEVLGWLADYRAEHAGRPAGGTGSQ